MELEYAIAAVVLVVIIALLVFKNSTVKGLKVLDVNKNGRVDADDVKAAVQHVAEGVKAVADINNDGKVDAADIKAAVKKTVDAVKKTTVKKPAPAKNPKK